MKAFLAAVLEHVTALQPAGTARCQQRMQEYHCTDQLPLTGDSAQCGVEDDVIGEGLMIRIVLRLSEDLNPTKSFLESTLTSGA